MSIFAPVDRPNVDLRFFWDFEVSKIDWSKSYKTVIARIVERGSPSEWEELIRFYGKEKVINALKNEIVFLPNYAIEEVCNYFNFKKEDMMCYWRKLSRPEHWI